MILEVKIHINYYYLENYKQIEGYKKHYHITDLGRVFSLKSSKFLKQSTDKDGYKLIVLSKLGKLKTHRVHRLVAIAFIPTHSGLLQINHKNGNKEDNKATNLEWVTDSENKYHSYRILHKQPSRGMLGKIGYWANKKGDNHFASKKVAQMTIYGEIINTWVSATEASITLGIHHSKICSVCRGERKQYKGYKWKYI